jgi:hypothetical protein
MSSTIVESVKTLPTTEQEFVTIWSLDAQRMSEASELWISEVAFDDLSVDEEE